LGRERYEETGIDCTAPIINCSKNQNLQWQGNRYKFEAIEIAEREREREREATNKKWRVESVKLSLLPGTSIFDFLFLFPNPVRVSTQFDLIVQFEVQFNSIEIAHLFD